MRIVGGGSCSLTVCIVVHFEIPHTSRKYGIEGFKEVPITPRDMGLEYLIGRKLPVWVGCRPTFFLPIRVCENFKLKACN